MTKIPIAFILLEDARLPDAEALIQSIHVRHPDLQCSRSTAAPSDSAARPMFIRIGGLIMTIFLIQEPVPFDQQLWERASWLWPEAFHAAGRHRAHLVIAAMDSAESNAETKALGFAERAPLTTAFVGAVLAAMPSVVAVIWQGKVCRSPEMWLEQSSRAFETYPDQPFGLWGKSSPFVPANSGSLYARIVRVR